MTMINHLMHGSGQPNFALIDHLMAWQRKAWAFAVITAIFLCVLSSVTLLFIETANRDTSLFYTAVLILLGCALSYLAHRPKTRLRQWLIWLTGTMIVSIASYFLLEAWLEKRWLVSAIVPNDSDFEPLTEFSLQVFVFFILYGCIGCLESALNKNGWKILDSLTLLMAFNVLLLIFGASLQILSARSSVLDAFYSLCTVFSIFALFSVLLVKRVQSGVFTVFLSVGIGSDVSRKILPLLIALPLLIVGLCVFIDNFKLFSFTQIATMIAAITACLLIALAMRLAAHVNALEKNLLDMSLMDDLTNIYNRRGFYLLGEHMLREGKRSGEPVMVLFFDLDGLKTVNDTLGHDVGSDLLTDFAVLLNTNFRNCDVVARVGGDEFAVVIQQDAYKIVLNRLKNSVETANRNNGKAYDIRYSVGVATTGKTRGGEKFADLVREADALMYQRKKQKQAKRSSSSSEPLDNGIMV